MADEQQLISPGEPDPVVVAKQNYDAAVTRYTMAQDNLDKVRAEYTDATQLLADARGAFQQATTDHLSKDPLAAGGSRTV